MPYIWNPKTNRSEWQNTWNGQDYGAEPTPPPQILPPGEHGNDPHYGGDPNAPAYTVDPTNPVDADGNGIAPVWDANQNTTTTPPPTPVPASAYDQAKSQMDAVFARYGRTPRADEYAQWIGPNGYISSKNYGGGQELAPYTGGQVPQYWLDRMAQHAQGDYWGNGATPSDNPGVQLPTWQDPGATDYDGGASHANVYSPGGPGANPFASHPAGGVWVPSLGQWVPGDHPLAQTPGAINVGAGELPSPGSSSSSGGTTSTMPASIQDQARERIMELLRTPRDVDPEKLRNSPEMQAVQLQAQRQEERDRGALAERAAANGWSGSGGFEGGLTALREKRGATEMDFMGQLAMQEMERNREDIKNGIEFALNQGQFDQAQALQRELAALDAAIEREKIAANVSMNAGDNALQRELGLGDQELRRMLGMSDLELRRYLGQLGSSFDFANLDFQKNKYLLDEGKV